MDDIKKEDMNLGIVKISDEVVSVIAGIAAAEIKGTADMSHGATAGITQLFTGKKNNSKGVKVNVEEESASIDVILNVDYGVKIPEVAAKVQENVRKAVETMTGLIVSSVNIYVQNIILPKENSSVETKEQ
ncbi:Asp23/Gls24 family envelope stress response protein [Clostridium sp. MSJ-4]|uniref:Asp23/Gls24 family envelope stress response protein n=1 Tax=Clostridium simiarum TaxID=2841506 RepID=A0ABS6EZG5_9CLOT|nr:MULTISPECIES: Asp23/Gls24 family envelope stress response protein [Clostridium]MBU5590752.1 Asp23/Gls24 family envelope stress response protein [Clostridium simiarum]